MKNFTLVLSEMAPNGCNDLLVLNNSWEVVEIIEECTFGHPSNTSVQPDLAMNYAGVCDVSELTNPETQGLYIVSIKEVLKRIAVSPVNNGSQTVAKLRTLGLI